MKKLFYHTKEISLLESTVNNVNLFNLNDKNIIKRKTQDNISLLFSNQSTVYLLSERTLKLLTKAESSMGKLIINNEEMILKLRH